MTARLYSFDFKFIMKQTSILVALFLLGMHGLSGQPLHTSQLLAYDEQIDQILRQMTLEEKIDMLHAKHMFTSAGVPRLGIADMHYVDGPFGIREEMQPDGWAGLGWETDKATFFPTGSALAATRKGGSSRRKAVSARPVLS